MVPPRWRVFRPARHEATQAVALMRGNMAKRWRVKAAAHACLSVSQFQRVFRATFGVSPVAYLSILRVLEMARLIRETNESIAIISEHVGWAPPGRPGIKKLPPIHGHKPEQLPASRPADRQCGRAGHRCRSGREKFRGIRRPRYRDIAIRRWSAADL